MYRQLECSCRLVAQERVRSVRIGEMGLAGYVSTTLYYDTVSMRMGTYQHPGKTLLVPLVIPDS
jgi:hypothetical protein